MNGLFITLEGPDGSGKSTIVKRLTTYLNEKEYDIITTRETRGNKNK
ncbi:dTMP kinase [Caldisalinibacter kiritimatiensis]